MRPHRLTVGHLIQLGNANTVFIRWNVLCHDVHCHLAEIEVGADSCCCRDAGGFNNIQNDLHGKVVGRQLVGREVVGHIHENLVDGVYHDVLRGDVFQIDFVNLRAVLHVIRHAGRCDNEVDFQLWILLQLGEETGFSFQHSARSVVLPSGICFLDSLPDFKEPATARNTIGFERRCDSKADGLICAAFICNYEVCVHRIKVALSTLNRSIEALEVDCNIGALLHTSMSLPSVKCALRQTGIG